MISFLFKHVGMAWWQTLTTFTNFLYWPALTLLQA